MNIAHSSLTARFDLTQKKQKKNTKKTWSKQHLMINKLAQWDHMPLSFYEHLWSCFIMSVMLSRWPYFSQWFPLGKVVMKQINIPLIELWLSWLCTDISDYYMLHVNCIVKGISKQINQLCQQEWPLAYFSSWWNRRKQLSSVCIKFTFSKSRVYLIISQKNGRWNSVW